MSLLEAMPRGRWIDNVVAQTFFDNRFEDADLKLRVMVGDKQKSTVPGNYPSPGASYDLRFALTDKEGKEVARRQLTVPAHIFYGSGNRSDIPYSVTSSLECGESLSL